MTPPRLSTTEYAVLGVLAEGPSHGFAISKQLNPTAELGRVFTVRRPLVYRALDRLVETGYAEAVSTEKGDAGPNRVIHRITRPGRRRLQRWLGEPVEHVRDLRIEFLLKLALIRRSGSSPADLISDQRTALDPTLSALDDPPSEPGDHVELWRHHNAAAAAAYLDELGSLYAQNRA
jgi:DNA-binding PadR family transcriptional regulator